LTAVVQRPGLWQRLQPWFSGFDGWLMLAIGLLAALGLVVMYSAGYDHGTRFVDHGRNMLIALAVMFVAAQVPPQRLMAWCCWWPRRCSASRRRARRAGSTWASSSSSPAKS
jgi:rod shape determining protein RodA